MVTDNLHVVKEGQADPKLGDSIENVYLSQVTAELKAGFRIVSLLKNGEDFKIKILHPNVKEEMELSAFYTKKYNVLMKNKEYMTRKEIERQLKDRGIWTDLEQKKLENLNESLQKLIEELNLLMIENPESKKIATLRSEYYKLRDRIFELSGEQSSHFINSIESICEHEQLLMKIVLCVKDENDKVIWSSWDSLMEEKDRLFLNTVIREAQMFWSGLTTEVLYSLPDVLEKIHQGARSKETSEK